MIRLTKLSDYSVLILGKLAATSEQINANQMTELCGLPYPTVSKILKKLTQGNILKATRGKSGGYTLVTPPNQLSFARIIEVIEGEQLFTDCCSEVENNCSLTQTCEPQSGLKGFHLKVRSLFQSHTLADLLSPENNTRSIATPTQENKLVTLRVPNINYEEAK